MPLGSSGMISPAIIIFPQKYDNGGLNKGLLVNIFCFGLILNLYRV